MLELPKRRAARPCPTPTNTGRLPYSRISSSPRWRGFESSRGWVHGTTSSASKNKLLSLDSTTISLCLSLFPWAKFRRSKGGANAHVLPLRDDYLCVSVLLTYA